MTTMLKDWTEPGKTIRKALPYDFQLLVNGKVCISNTRGQRLNVTRSQVERQLERDDLDPHRRKMYEAALEEWKNAAKQQEEEKQ